MIDGGTNYDILIGRRGDDTYIVDDVKDKVVEKPGEGVDTIETSINLDSAVTASEVSLDSNKALVNTLGENVGNEVKSLSVVLPANVENITLTGDAIYAVGNDLANEITGTDSANILKAGTSVKNVVDTLIGLGGNDVYIVDSTNDVVTEVTGGGDDTVRSYATFTLPAEVENLELIGSLVANATGNALPNTIYGNKAANVIDGGAGADTLYGWAPIANGASAVDTFKFASGSDADGDTIKAFDSTDLIDLSAISAGNTAVSSDFVFIGAITTANPVDTASGKNQVGYVAVDASDSIPAHLAVSGYLASDGNTTSSTADFTIKVELSGITALVPTDFIL
jgi:Ca2+-binding RTX toxin-like protein